MPCNLQPHNQALTNMLNLFRNANPLDALLTEVFGDDPIIADIRSTINDAKRILDGFDINSLNPFEEEDEVTLTQSPSPLPSPSPSPSLALTHSLAHSLTDSLTDSLTHSLTH